MSYKSLFWVLLGATLLVAPSLLFLIPGEDYSEIVFYTGVGWISFCVTGGLFCASLASKQWREDDTNI